MVCCELTIKVFILINATMGMVLMIERFMLKKSDDGRNKDRYSGDNENHT
jgi:hypothetical protein